MAELRKWAAGKLKRAGDQRARLQRIATLDLPSGMEAHLGSQAFAALVKYRKDRGQAKMPVWRHGAPIPCRAQESELNLDASGKVVLTVKLAPVGRVDLAVIAGRGSHWEKLRALARGDSGVKRGDVKIKYDERQKKWFAFIAYSEPEPKMPATCDTALTLALHRGHRNMLVAMSSNGHYSVIATGGKLLAFKRAIHARKLSNKQIRKAERGGGAAGHGVDRRVEFAAALADKEARFLRTFCQQIGARVAQITKQWGCGRVVIEEYGGIEPDEERGKRMYVERFPNAELKTSVAWSLRKIGIALGEYGHGYISQTCPACGNVDARNYTPRTNMFHCGACEFDRPADFVAALHGLRSAHGNGGEWDQRLKREAKFARSLKTETDDPKEPSR